MVFESMNKKSKHKIKAKYLEFLKARKYCLKISCSCKLIEITIVKSFRLVKVGIGKRRNSLII